MSARANVSLDLSKARDALNVKRKERQMAKESRRSEKLTMQKLAESQRQRQANDRNTVLQELLGGENNSLEDGSYNEKAVRFLQENYATTKHSNRELSRELKIKEAKSQELRILIDNVTERYILKRQIFIESLTKLEKNFRENKFLEDEITDECTEIEKSVSRLSSIKDNLEQVQKLNDLYLESKSYVEILKNDVEILEKILMDNKNINSVTQSYKDKDKEKDQDLYQIIWEDGVLSLQSCLKLYRDEKCIVYDSINEVLNQMRIHSGSHGNVSNTSSLFSPSSTYASESHSRYVGRYEYRGSGFSNYSKIGSNNGFNMVSKLHSVSSQSANDGSNSSQQQSSSLILFSNTIAMSNEKFVNESKYSSSNCSSIPQSLELLYLSKSKNDNVDVDNVKDSLDYQNWLSTLLCPGLSEKGVERVSEILKKLYEAYDDYNNIKSDNDGIV